MPIMFFPMSWGCCYQEIDIGDSLNADSRCTVISHVLADNSMLDFVCMTLLVSVANVLLTGIMSDCVSCLFIKRH